MENNKALNGLYPITPSIYKSDIDYLYHIKIVIKSGINILQFRSKNLSFRRKAYLIKSISFIKKKLGKKPSKILYGGSVNSDNINQLKNINIIDGFLIGGASQDPKKFIDIIKKTIN